MGPEFDPIEIDPKWPRKYGVEGRECRFVNGVTWRQCHVHPNPQEAWMEFNADNFPPDGPLRPHGENGVDTCLWCLGEKKRVKHPVRPKMNQSYNEYVAEMQRIRTEKARVKAECRDRLAELEEERIMYDRMWREKSA